MIEHGAFRTRERFVGALTTVSLPVRVPAWVGVKVSLPPEPTAACAEPGASNAAARAMDRASSAGTAVVRRGRARAPAGAAYRARSTARQPCGAGRLGMVIASPLRPQAVAATDNGLLAPDLAPASGGAILSLRMIRVRAITAGREDPRRQAGTERKHARTPIT